MPYRHPRLHPVNDPLADLSGTYVLPCECGHPTCDELIELPAEAYDALAAAGQRIVHPLHGRRLDGRSLRRSDGYLVVG